MRARYFELCVLPIVLLASVAFAGGAHAACMSKPAANPSGKQHVIAPKGEIARYQALGYAVEQCDVPLDQLSRSVDTICKMAASAPSAVQAHVASSHGLPLNELCASGRAGLAEMLATTKPP